LCTKFLAFNVDFDGPSLDFSGSRQRVHEGIKEWYPHKSWYFTTVGQFFVKTVADRHGRAAYHKGLVMSFLVVSTLMSLKDPELSK